MLAREQDVHGPDAELNEFCKQFYDKMIPRFVRFFTVFRFIKPVLIHGDLWYGNCCTDNATGKPIVCDEFGNDFTSESSTGECFTGSEFAGKGTSAR